MKNYFTYNHQEAEDFRKIGDNRPVKTKYYIQEDIFSGYAGDVLH